MKEKHDLGILGVADKKIAQFSKKKIESIEDLLRFLPTYYMDYSTVVEIKDLKQYINTPVTVRGRVDFVRLGLKTFTAVVRDGDVKMTVTWFNQPYIASKIRRGEKYFFCGVPKENDPAYVIDDEICNMAAPIAFGPDTNSHRPIIPHYRKIAGMSTEYLESKIDVALDVMQTEHLLPDYMDRQLLHDLDVCDYNSFLKKAHKPKDKNDLALIERRKAIDILFPFAFKLKARDTEYVEKSPFHIKQTTAQKKYIDGLPFELTKDQEATIVALTHKMKNGERVDALVQGDVGCGKTVVAAALTVAAAENGYQVALMCPTTVLAGQHYENFKRELTPLGIHVEFFRSGISAKEKKALVDDLQAGNIDVVVGTHAVISDMVKFKNLALTIVDEEHRFGVNHRDKLARKAQMGVHNISMSATPIPRTLALTVYGKHTEVFNIHTMPNGRKPVKTILYEGPEEKVYMSMYRQIKAGHQCYVVCPLIEDSEGEKIRDVDSVEKTYKKLCAWFGRFPEIRIEQIDGKLKQETVEKRIAEFAAGHCQIIVSTTIVEVGVNVPNATVMFIKGAERFGLAQLHQLRGRVGRGDAQSYCLMLPTHPKMEHERLKIMAETADGFEIAEKDLELRGMGEIVGMRQSGLDLAVNTMLLNPELYRGVKESVDSIFQDKERYGFYKNIMTKERDIEEK